MSEYWKSTPKYWCKHCSTFVRDTKLEKTNHEATPKHQGNLKRFLRDLHRGHEKDQKDKERAKAEVARLNGVVSGEGSSAGASSSSSKVTTYTKAPVPRPQATAAQRKQQLAQLVEMGVAIPDELRPDMAMAGEWEVTSERIVEEEEEKKPEAVALGVRKRPVDEEEEEALEAKKKRWGSTYKSHPGEEEDGDLDALLSHATRKGKEMKSEKEADFGGRSEIKPEIKPETEQEGGTAEILGEGAKEEIGEELVSAGIKTEPLEGVDSLVTGLETSESVGVFFKKRKAKNIRQK